MAKGCIAVVVLIAASSAPALAGPEHLDIIYEQCGVQLQKSPAVCGCVSDSAATDLSEDQQAFMAAQVTSNGTEIARTQALLDQTEALGVMQFMTTVVQACGG